MTPRLKKIYEMAKADSEYCEQMDATEGNFVPSLFSDEAAKIAFAAMYSGWLLRAKGVDDYNSMIGEI